MPILKEPLRRDDFEGEIGGVCAGLARSLGWDVGLVRLAFVLAAILGSGVPVLIYIAAWIALPED